MVNQGIVLACLLFVAAFVSAEVGSLGPVGGPGGNSFDDGTHSMISGFIIRSYYSVDSIQFIYWDETGPMRGSSGSVRNDDVSIVSLPEDEVIIGFTARVGYFYWVFDTPVFQQLTIFTNRSNVINTYGPYGSIINGTETTVMVPENHFVTGIFGAAGSAVDSLGLHYDEIFTY